MSLKSLLKSFPWIDYSIKLSKKISNPRSYGEIKQEDAKDFRLVKKSIGEIEEGNYALFYLLVDENDGIVVDAKYQMIGESALIGALEALVELIVGKNYDQASRISMDVLDHHLRDDSEKKAFPDDVAAHFSLALDLLKSCTKECMDIPLSLKYEAPPISSGMSELFEGDGIEGFKDLSKQEKLSLIDQVLDHEIRPFIEMDAGGVQVLNLSDDLELLIAYQGSCTNCFAATGSTLSFIQQVLRAKIDKQITVVPDL